MTEERKDMGVEENVMMRRTMTEPYTREKLEGPVTWEEMRALLRPMPPFISGMTWRPPTAGILMIVGGALNLLSGIGLITGFTIVSIANAFGLTTAPGGIVAGIALAVAGIISIIGGYFAVRRRSWGWALTGSILEMFPSPMFLFGFLSLIFVTISKPEFR